MRKAIVVAAVAGLAAAGGGTALASGSSTACATQHATVLGGRQTLVSATLKIHTDRAIVMVQYPSGVERGSKRLREVWRRDRDSNPG